ncbi:hypothetical protein [Streptomyces sp. NPDC059909]|uniref:hypothetical protein n=1 Tax=Streptomyces sp. NPDC059909 TaxID=3346998 RepID=UPI00364A69C0
MRPGGIRLLGWAHDDDCLSRHALPGPRAAPSAPRAGALIVGGAAMVLLVAALAQGCAWVAGGPVTPEAAFREHLRHTQEAGEEAVRRLGMDPASMADQREMVYASC